MALIDCPDCGNKISTAAPACPKCGRPIATHVQPVVVVQPPPKQKTGVFTWIVGFVGLLWFMGYWGAKLDPSNGKPAAQEAVAAAAAPARRTAFSVEPSELLADYVANEVRTNDMFADRDIQVSGSILEIGEMLGDPFIEFGTGTKFHNVHANILPAFRSQVAKLSIGSQATVRCHHSAFILSSPVLYKCEVF